MSALPLQTLYGRAYSLTMGPAVGGGGFRFGNMDNLSSGLRIAFDIDKIAQGAANKGTITLFNISQTARNAIVQGYQVVLKAGYLGLTDIVFSGTVFKATSQRAGPDISTTLNVLDGLKSVLYSNFDRAYPPGTKLWRILSDVAQAMDVLPGVVVGVPNKTFARGYAAHGLCINILQELLKPYSREFAVNNGKLNILPHGGTLGTAAIVLSPQTGLLGVPSVNPTCVTFDALLNPRIVPGQIVQLVTANPNTSGFFTVRSCKMTGDTHDSAWSVSCQAVAAANVTAATGVAHGFAYDSAVIPGLL